MMKKKVVKIIKVNDANILMQMHLSESELSVLKCALRDYKNGIGLALLKRIEKEENNR